MRRRFSLDLTEATLQRGLFLFHGGYAAGKTHLGADMLRYYAPHGEVRFLNVIGEDGFLAAASHNLGDIAETVETYDDMMAALGEYASKKVLALVVDSLKPASRLAMAHAIGTDSRQPKVGGNVNEWGDVHFEMERLVNRIRTAATYVVCLCPSDKSVNQLDGRTYITPDLPGRQAAGSAGWFDFVGYISSDVQGEGRVVRKVRFAPNMTILTRQRLPTPIVNDIVIPEGGGGWKAILDAINSRLQVKTT